MKLAQTSTTNLVVLVLGVALVVFFAGVSAVLAVTGSAPTAMWAAGAAISGALVGLLVPPPGRQAAAQLGATTTIRELGDGAVQAAQQAAQKEGVDAEAGQQAVQRLQDLTGRLRTAGFAQAAHVDPAKAPEVAATNTVDTLEALKTSAPPGSTEAVVYGAAADVANQNKGAAQDQGNGAVDAAGGTSKLTGIVWMLLGLFCGLLAIGIGMSFIPSEGDQLIREAGKTVLALASSAGGALIGVLAPKPSAG